LAHLWNIWTYYFYTEDLEFIKKYGAEIFFDICKFWGSKCEFDAATGKYSIRKVMGPDEYHESLPGSEEGGLKDNAYTNIMVCWSFKKAFEIMQVLDA